MALHSETAFETDICKHLDDRGRLRALTPTGGTGQIDPRGLAGAERTPDFIAACARHKRA
ncbi:hypothetical protein [Ottowia sp.]|uniref:hypothetical protein n=1 Tax=Ottowia sp. TaxID=1898956 RepID=UPI0026314C45|nr:hypothetical protein [Ottowia sp.]